MCTDGEPWDTAQATSDPPCVWCRKWHEGRCYGKVMWSVCEEPRGITEDPAADIHISDLSQFINSEQVGPGIGAEAPFERARGLLAIEVEYEISGGEKAGGVAGEHRLVDEVLGEHRLAEALRAHEDDVLPLGEEVERENALEGGAMELLGPRPVPIRHRFEAAEARVAQLAFDAPADARVHFGLGEGFEQDDGTPALLRRAGDEIVQVVG